MEARMARDSTNAYYENAPDLCHLYLNLFYYKAIRFLLATTQRLLQFCSGLAHMRDSPQLVQGRTHSDGLAYPRNPFPGANVI